MKNQKPNTLLFLACLTMIFASCTSHTSDPAAPTVVDSTSHRDTTQTTPAAAAAPATPDTPAAPAPPAAAKEKMQSKNSTTLHLSAADNDKTIAVQKGQKIELTLRNPGDGGYTFNAPELNVSLLKLDSHIYHAAPKDANPGNYGNDVWIFSAVGAGQADLLITASRSWEKGKKSTSFSAKLRIQ